MRRGRLCVRCGVLAGLALCLAGSAAALERAWVGGEVHLNLRAGPGTQYRILRVAKTGDAVKVLERGDGWTQVSMADGVQGWIPAGYLATEPPAAVRVARLEEEVKDLRSRLETLSAEAEQLRQENVTLKDRDGTQQSRIQELTAENLDLKAGERWPYLIVGASILAAGMIVGAILYGTSTRRRQPRIRF